MAATTKAARLWLRVILSMADYDASKLEDKNMLRRKERKKRRNIKILDIRTWGGTLKDDVILCVNIGNLRSTVRAHTCFY